MAQLMVVHGAQCTAHRGRFSAIAQLKFMTVYCALLVDVHNRMSTITFGYQIAMLFPCSNREISIVYWYADIVGLLELLSPLLMHLRANNKFYLYFAMKSSRNGSNHPLMWCFRQTAFFFFIRISKTFFRLERS